MKVICLMIISLVFLTGCFGSQKDENTQNLIPGDSTETLQNQKLEEQEVIEIDPVQLQKDLATLDVLMDEKKYSQARDTALEMLGKYPDVFRLLSRTGRIFMELADYKTALDYLLSASELTQDTNVNILYNIALCYRNLSDEKNAKKYIERILKIDPENEQALTFSTGDGGNDDLTLEFIEKELEKNPNNGNLLGILGKIQMEKGDYEAAKETLTKAYEVTDGEDIEIISSLGVVHHNDHDSEGFAKAAELYEEALRLDPKNTNLKDIVDHNTSSSEIFGGIDRANEILYDSDPSNNDQAYKNIQELIKKYPKEKGLIQWYGEALMIQGEYSSALKELQKLEGLELDEGEEKAYVFFLLGETHFAMGNTQKSREYIQRSLEENPNLGEAQEFLEQKF